MTSDARAKRVDKGPAGVVVAGGGSRDEIDGQPVRGKTSARVHILVEAIFDW